MAWYSGLFSRRSRQPRRPTIRQLRGYASGKQDFLTAGFMGTSRSADAELKTDLVKLRGRSRQLAIDNDYARKFLFMAKSNIIGVKGIRLQAQTRREDGQDDTVDNRRIERAWAEWGKPGNCDVTRSLSWLDVQNLFVESIARDGEVLLRLVPGFDNDAGFAVQVLEVDHLDERKNERTESGSVVMGVEKNEWGQPVAYHLRKNHPGNVSGVSPAEQVRRIAADKIIHAFLVERPGQTRGLPWMTTSIRRLNMLGGFEEAELVASRVAASKMGFFTSPTGDEYVGDGEAEDGAIISDAEPGAFEQLPDGMGVQMFDPQHPNTAFGDFVKACLRGAASGLNIAYNTFANDLEGVNFSSIRAGVLEERDQWKRLQNWVIERLCGPVYSMWLDQVLLNQSLPLPPRKVAKFREVVWHPRGFAWVDPQKDLAASADGVALGVQTRQDVVAAQGKNLPEVFEQLRREQDMAQALGISVSPDAAAPAAAAE